MLGAFGMNQAERQGLTSSQKPKVLEKLEAKGIPLYILLWLGARLPFAAFVAIVGMFTYMYHILPLLPWLLVFLSIDFAIVVCWPPKMIGTKRRGFWDWAPMMSWFFAIGFAVLFGLLNYGIIESWVNAVFLREYKNVLPSTNPAEVSDAGVLTFAEGTRLETESAAGYKFWFYNYCAAPIVHGADPGAKPITFWAVGVGCCKSRGEFTCDSAADKTTRSAMPLRAHNLGPEITSHYNHAIRMAAAANDLEVTKDPVFVLWHKDPHAVGKFAWWISTSLFLVFIILSLCACCGCQAALTHLSVMHQSNY